MTTARPLPQLPAWFWPSVLTCAAMLALTLLIDPLYRMTALPPIGYNEGWNAYHQQEALRGELLYGKPPGFTNNNYPPLSFHLIAWLTPRGADVNRTGRIVAIGSFFLVAMMCGSIVRLLGGSAALGAFAALNVVIWLIVFKPDRIGANEPQYLATAVSLTGLYIYLRAGGRLLWIASCAVLFVVAVFIKHNLLAYPAAVALHMAFERRWKNLALWIAVAGSLSVLLLAATLRFDGPYFLAGVLIPRARSGFLTIHIRDHLVLFQLAIAVAAVWALRNLRGSSCFVIALALVVSHVLGLAFSAADGADINHLIDAVLCLIMAGALAFAEFAPALLEAFARPITRIAALAALLAAPSAGILAEVPVQWLNEYFDLTYHAPRRIALFDAELNRLKSIPAPISCENPLLCFEAGKPLVLDLFESFAEMRVGRVKQQDIVAWLKNKRLNAVQIEDTSQQSLQLRYPAAFLEELAKNYHVDPELPNVYLPNP
jgi:hypothetical protein